MVSTPNGKPGQQLSDRQLQVMQLLAAGYSRKEIGEALGLAGNTVTAHVRSAYIRLGAYDEIEAFRALGWLRTPDKGDMAAVNVRQELLNLREVVAAAIARFRGMRFA